MMLEQKGEMVEGLYNITDRYWYIVVGFFCHEHFVGTLVELVCNTFFVVHQADGRRPKDRGPCQGRCGSVPHPAHRL